MGRNRIRYDGNNLIRELRTYNNYRGWLYSIADTTQADGKSIYSVTYNHNSNDNLHGYQEIMNGNWQYGAAGPVSNSWTYLYDYLNRLQTGTSSNNGTFTYTYDRWGNRWNQTGGTQTMMLTFNNHNQIACNPTCYDFAGNMTSFYDGLVTHHYTYDAENRLTGVDGTTSYTYDAEGKRIGVYTNGALTKSYLRDKDQNAELVFDGSGNVATFDVFAAGRHVFNWNAGYWYYPIQDALGTTKAVVDDINGWVLEICTNLAFGDGMNCQNNDPTPFHYTNKERDSESGLDYMDARLLRELYGTLHVARSTWGTSRRPSDAESIRLREK